VPYHTSQENLRNPDWIPAIDGLNGAMGEIRRFSSFRVHSPSHAPVVDTRLVGRSVSNTEWLLVIPGQTFLANPAVGLESFINTVTDIKLTLDTYGISGN
jgi:hypothetical protein